MNRFLHSFYIALAILPLIAAGSCTMIEDNVSDCPTGLYVRFVYDYNTARADMFKDHVGHVTLYVYDEDGNKVAERSVSNTAADAPLAGYAYAIHLNPAELPAGRYRLQAVAMQKDWDDALTTDGAKYRRTSVSDATSLSVTLDHAADPDFMTGTHTIEHQSAPLDTLWHTLKVMSLEPCDGSVAPDLQRTSAPYSVYPMEDQYVTVINDRATYATVSLIRDTKHLNLTLRQLELPEAVHHSDYEITLVDDNATVAHDNAVVTGKPLLYTPYAAWTTRFSNDGLEVEDSPLARADDNDDGDYTVQRTAHFNLMFNRTMYHSNPDDCGTLQIRNKKTGKTVARINLPYILAQGRTAYELYNYKPQEYLDREYDYHLDFLLRGDTWAYCDVVINVLGWSHRVQNHEL